MSEYYQDELVLRRRLLFRILRTFDFDNPTFNDENAIYKQPQACGYGNWSKDDQFDFAFKASANL